MGSPSQFCEDLDCDHTVNGICCKSLPHPQIKQTRLKKKKVKKRTPKEWVSDSYKNALSALHHLFCVSTKDLLGKWRFTRSLNWYSTPEYVNRLLMVGGKVISNKKTSMVLNPEFKTFTSSILFCQRYSFIFYL